MNGRHGFGRVVSEGLDIPLPAADLVRPRSRVRRSCGARGVVPKKNIKFIAALAGSRFLVIVVANGQIQANEFATRLNEVSRLFVAPYGNPGTVGTRYLHFPGWHQQFLHAHQ